MKKPIRFDEYELATWTQRRLDEQQVRRAMRSREDSESDLLWGFGGIVSVPVLILLAVMVAPLIGGCS